jgi:hypothetical protein
MARNNPDDDPFKHAYKTMHGKKHPKEEPVAQSSVPVSAYTSEEEKLLRRIKENPELLEHVMNQKTNEREENRQGKSRAMLEMEKDNERQLRNEGDLSGWRHPQQPEPEMSEWDPHPNDNPNLENVGSVPKELSFEEEMLLRKKQYLAAAAKGSDAREDVRNVPSVGATRNHLTLDSAGKTNSEPANSESAKASGFTSKFSPPAVAPEKVKIKFELPFGKKEAKPQEIKQEKETVNIGLPFGKKKVPDKFRAMLDEEEGKAYAEEESPWRRR